MSTQERISLTKEPETSPQSEEFARIRARRHKKLAVAIVPLAAGAFFFGKALGSESEPYSAPDSSTEQLYDELDCKPGDLVKLDNGVTYTDLMNQLGTELNIPPDMAGMLIIEATDESDIDDTDNITFSIPDCQER